jgi:hypothetical protein
MSCPGADSLRDLLDGRLLPEEHAEFNQHLESCPSCQQALEGLVAGRESWLGAAQRLGGEKVESDEALREVISDLKCATGPTRTHVGDGAYARATLDFLSPPDKQGILGKLDRYEVLEVIGRGAFGTVLKAFDPKLHRFVAIKVLAPQLAASAAARQRFAREAQAAAAVSHEHVVAIHAVEETNGLPFLIMPYVAGLSLQEKLDRTGPLDLLRILRIGMQTASGLAAAHAQGLIHRDIKPANILLENGVERVKITDFGLARAVDDASLTQSGVVTGTPQYMAPEQARGESLDHRADLFSLGSVLYAMCTGRAPFRASTTMGVLRRVSEERARPIGEVNPSIPAWLIALIEKLHAKDPAQRYQSAAEVADVLGLYLAHIQQPHLVAPPAPAHVGTGPRSGFWTNPLGTALARRESWVAAALVLFFVGVALYVQRQGARRSLALAEPHAEVEAAADAAAEADADRTASKYSFASKNGFWVDREEIARRRENAKRQQEKREFERDTQRLARDMERAAQHTQKEISQKVIESLRKSGIPVPPTVPGVPGHPTPPTSLPRQPGSVEAIAFSPDGDELATATCDGAVTVWKRATQEAIAKTVAPAPVRRLTFSGDGERLFMTTEEGKLFVWDIEAEEPPKACRCNDLQALLPGCDGATLGVQRDGTEVRLVELGSGEAVKRVLEHPAKVRSVVVAPSQCLMATACADGMATLWDIAAGKQIDRFKIPSERLLGAAKAADGRVLLAYDTGNSVRLFDVRARSETPLLGGQRVPAGRLVFSADANHVAVVINKAGLMIWDTRKNGGPPLHLHIPDGSVNCVAFSPDGTTVSAGGDKGEVNSWSLGG